MHNFFVPFDNNKAESNKSKVSLLFCTKTGVHSNHTITSYLSTVKHQVINVLESLSLDFKAETEKLFFIVGSE